MVLTHLPKVQSLVCYLYTNLLYRQFWTDCQTACTKTKCDRAS